MATRKQSSVAYKERVLEVMGLFKKHVLDQKWSQGEADLVWLNLVHGVAQLGAWCGSA